MKTVPLGEVAVIERSGVNPKRLDAATPYLGLEHIERGGRIVGRSTVGDSELASTKFRFSELHVLYGKLRPNLGKVSRPDFAGVCSTDILPIRPGPDLDRAYLHRYLSQPVMVEFAASRTSGANLPRLSPTVLATFPVPLPRIEEQRRIAAILDQADAVRAKRRQVLAHLDVLPEAIFRRMFASEALTPVGALLHFKSGAFLPAKEQRGGAVPVYGGNGITGYHDVALLHDPVVVVGRVGAYCGAVHLTDGPAWVTDNAMFVSASERPFQMEFLEAALRYANLNQYASRSGQPLVSSERINRAGLPTPTPERQRCFSERVRGVRECQSACEWAARRCDVLFVSLQAQAFRGEL